MQAVREISVAAKLIYTHPIKSRNNITTAYLAYGIRTFVIDSRSELLKLADIVDLQVCEIMLRIKIPILSASALQNLDEKFGVPPEEAGNLLRLIAKRGARVGVCFHVGSQQEFPDAHWAAIEFLSGLLKDIDVNICILSIGGLSLIHISEPTRPY